MQGTKANIFCQKMLEFMTEPCKLDLRGQHANKNDLNTKKLQQDMNESTPTNLPLTPGVELAISITEKS